MLRRFSVLSAAAAITVAAFVVLFSTLEAHPATGLSAIDAGWSRGCAIDEEGNARCWGAIYGTTLTAVPGAGDAVAISVGGAHACVVTATGGARCWGANAEGQLGDGTFAERLEPGDVTGLSEGIVEVAAGGFFTCALSTADDVRCWGDNSRGQAGDGTSGNYRTSPVDVAGLPDGISGTAAGDDHACAIAQTGGVFCWGNNGAGQLGDGTNGGLRATAAPVSGLAMGVTALALGADHTCALLGTGTVTCWGDNSRGQLGDGSTASSTTPVAVTGLSGVRAIAAGQDSTCALRSEGGVHCWGANDYGQVGDGTTTQRRAPAPVAGLDDAAGISAGAGFACARTTSGGASCWGLNDSGQLGDGTLLQRLTPVALVFEAKPEPVVTEGDANCDEQIDAIDAAVILQHGAGLLASLPCPTAADANDDGVADSRDAALVLQHVAGLIALG